MTSEELRQSYKIWLDVDAPRELVAGLARDKQILLAVIRRLNDEVQLGPYIDPVTSGITGAVYSGYLPPDHGYNTPVLKEVTK